VKNAGLAQAKLDLAKTVVKAPFDCRLGEVEIEPGQYLAAGQSLFESHGTALTEVEIQIPLDQLRTLLLSTIPRIHLLMRIPSHGFASVTAAVGSPAPSSLSLPLSATTRYSIDLAVGAR